MSQCIVPVVKILKYSYNFSHASHPIPFIGSPYYVLEKEPVARLLLPKEAWNPVWCYTSC